MSSTETGARRKAKASVEQTYRQTIIEVAQASDSAQTELLIGSHGWSSTQLNWMYPKGLNPVGKLQFYSQMFNAVEVDQTFYGLDCLEPYRSWLEVVPPHFRFSLKTPRVITHEKRLHNADAELNEFLAAARKFGDHLGPILVQLSPKFTVEYAEWLRVFLKKLPFGEMEFAIEVRDHFLWSEEVPYLMEKHPFIPVTTNLVSSPQRLRSSNGRAYIRWLGPRMDFEGPLKTPEQFYEESFAWSESIRDMQSDGALKSLSAFVDHEYFGPGVIGAARLRKLLDDPVQFPGALF